MKVQLSRVSVTSCYSIASSTPDLFQYIIIVMALDWIDAWRSRWKSNCYRSCRPLFGFSSCCQCHVCDEIRLSFCCFRVWKPVSAIIRLNPLSPSIGTAIIFDSSVFLSRLSFVFRFQSLVPIHGNWWRCHRPSLHIETSKRCRLHSCI